MNDIFVKIYNGFLLRDLLGYVLPGSFVLLCLAHLFSEVSGISTAQLAGMATENVFTYVLVFGLCYACGHFLSGLFFHSPLLRRVFRYTPGNLLDDYPGMKRDQAWIEHRASYRKACDSIGEATQEQIERHAALVHFTGHFSAGILFAIGYVCFLAIHYGETRYLLYGVPLLIVFPGIYTHYKRLLFERYSLERIAIMSSFSHQAAGKVIEMKAGAGDAPRLPVAP